MTNKTDFTFLSSDGKTRLHGIAWVPEDVTPVAVLQIVHGVAEYIGRYDDFARFLNSHGVIVVGHDHLGHGLSLPEGGTPVYFGDGNTWNTPVDDIYVLHTKLKEQYPHLPLLLMGHSMGSFLSRTYLIRYPGTVKAAVLMGTGWQSAATLAGGLALAGTLARRGAASTNAAVTALAFGAYNKTFKPNRTEYDCRRTRRTWTNISPIPCAATTPRWGCSVRCCGASASTSGPPTCGKWTRPRRCC